VLASLFAFYGCASTSIADSSTISTISVVETKKEDDRGSQATSPSQNIASEVVFLPEIENLSDESTSNSIPKNALTLKDNNDFSPSINASLPLDTQTSMIESNEQASGALYLEDERTEQPNLDPLLEQSFPLVHTFSVVETKREDDLRVQGSSPSQSTASSVGARSITEDLSDDKTPHSINKNNLALKDSAESYPSFKTSLPQDAQADTIDSVTQGSGALYVEYEEAEHPSPEDSLFGETLLLYPSFSSESFDDTHALGGGSDITKIETVADFKPHEISSDSHETVGVSQLNDEKSMRDPGSFPGINENSFKQGFVVVAGAESTNVRSQTVDPSARESNNDNNLSTVSAVIPSADKEDHQLPVSREAATSFLLPAANAESSQKEPIGVLNPVDYRNERSLSLIGAVNPLPATDQGTSDTRERSTQETSDATPPKPIQSVADAGSLLGLGVVILLVILFAFSRKKKRKKRLNKPLYRENVASGKSLKANVNRENKEHTFVPDNRTIEGGEQMYSVHIVENERTASSYSIPKSPQKHATGFGAVRWVSAGKTIEINGFQIDGGMLYVGSKVTGTAVDPSFINIKLPVSNFTDYTVRLTSYWPSYSQISSDARGAYLAWLADGRKDPRADVGYVFLFFYGLERRVLVDYQETGIDDTELIQIKSEVNRLFSIYGSQSNSVKGYFSNFLSLLLLLERRNSKLYDWPIPENLKGYDLPFYLKAYLGQCSVDGKPLPAQAAYQWVTYDPTLSKRTPARRCEVELQQLFLLRYDEAFGNGLQLPVNKKKLKISYHAASSHMYGFTLDIDTYQDLPDVTVPTSISGKLKQIFDNCSDELDRYSRYLGKTGKELGDKKSLVLLPTELVVKLRRDFLKTIHDQLSLNDSMTTPVSFLLKEILDEEMPTREATCALAKVLEMDGISMEPDVLAYTYELKNENKVLLFVNNDRAPQERDNSTYLLNVMMVELSYAVAQADGIVDDKEIQSIQQYLDSLQQISSYHMLRLQKHLEFLQYTPVRESSMKKKLKGIPSADLSVLLASVNNVVLADGIIDHAEIQFLEKLYQYLGLDYSQLYHQLHSPKAFGATQIQDSDRPLDYERVASLKIESAEVSSILSEIFSSDEEDPRQAELPIADEEEEQENPLGLDDEQMEFLAGLVSKTSWSREELQEMAGKHGIMLDGTLEHVNENSLELYGIPVTEGDDPIEILEEFRGRTVWQ